MYYVYVLLDKETNEPYIGYSNNVEKRFKQHFTEGMDAKLVYYEAYLNEKEARTRERKLKSYGSTWRALKQRLRTSSPQMA